MNFVENELWRSSRCFVQMRPRFRLAYSAILCSFTPFCSRLAYETLNNKELVHLPDCVAIGVANGAFLMASCLSFDFALVASAGIAGGIYGGLYSLALRKMVTAESESSSDADSKYVDKSFKL